MCGQRSVEMEAADFSPVPLTQTEGPVRLGVTEKLFLTHRIVAAGPRVGK